MGFVPGGQRAAHHRRQADRAVGAGARATLALGAALPVRLAFAQERFDALAGVGGGFEPAGRRSLPIVALGFPAVFMRGKVFLVSGLADVAVATGWGSAVPATARRARNSAWLDPRSGSLKSHNARLSAVTSVSVQVRGGLPQG